MEDLPNYDNFTGPGTVLYSELNSCYNDSGERCCPLGCEWDFLHFFDGNSPDFDWMSQPMGSLSTNQAPEFATEAWPNQLDMSLIGNFEQPALPVGLEQSLFMSPTTLGHVQSSLPAPFQTCIPLGMFPLPHPQCSVISFQYQAPKRRRSQFLFHKVQTPLHPLFMSATFVLSPAQPPNA
jgi:hypothetical protein